MAARIFHTLRPVRSSSCSLRSLCGSRRQALQPAFQISRVASTPTYATTSTPVRKYQQPSSSKNGVVDPQAAIPPAADAQASSVDSINEPPPTVNGNGNAIDWGNSFHGLSMAPFSPETAELLMRPIDFADVEMKPDGIIYLPEIKYRRILNAAFGPGGWGLAPRGELVVGEKVVSREYALVVQGRFIAQARGECNYFSEETIHTAGEGCKSNALLRCCKDLGIASELWDPRYIREFKKKHCHEVWVEHVVTKKRKQIWLRKDCDPAYPFTKPSGSTPARPTASTPARASASTPARPSANAVKKAISG